MSLNRRARLIPAGLTVAAALLLPGGASAVPGNGCVVSQPSIAPAGVPVTRESRCSYISTGPGGYAAASDGLWTLTVRRGDSVVLSLSSDKPGAGTLDTVGGDMVTLTLAPGAKGSVAGGDS